MKKRTVEELERITSQLSLDSLDDLLSTTKAVRMQDSTDRSHIAPFVQGIRCSNCPDDAKVIGIHNGTQVYVCDKCNDLLWN
jgi:hypothetical protein